MGLQSRTRLSDLHFLSLSLRVNKGFPGGASGKEPSANAGDIRCVGLIPGSGRSPAEGNGNPLQLAGL